MFLYIMYMYIEYSSVFYIYIYAKWNLTENSNFRLFAANGKRKWQLLFDRCKWKQKTEICFLWLTSGKQ
jgi:hypothetical protein